MKTLQDKIDCNVFEIPYDLTNGKYLNVLIVNKAIQELREEIGQIKLPIDATIQYAHGVSYALDKVLALIGEKK